MPESTEAAKAATGTVLTWLSCRRRPNVPVRIGILGEAAPGFAPVDTIEESLRHAAGQLGVELMVRWLATLPLQAAPHEAVIGLDGLFAAPGVPDSLDGALGGIRYAREHDVPFLGTCGGFQHAVLEFARQVAGIGGAAHQYYAPEAQSLVVTPLACSLAGTTMRVDIAPGSLAARQPASADARLRESGVAEGSVGRLPAVMRRLESTARSRRSRRRFRDPANSSRVPYAVYMAGVGTPGLSRR
jgi:CTP synthase (UTP-ammonia lyase)